MRWLAFLGMAFALIAAGCGAGDEQAAPSEETTTEETIPDCGSDKESGDDFASRYSPPACSSRGAYLDPGSVNQDGLAGMFKCVRSTSGIRARNSSSTCKRVNVPPERHVKPSAR